MRKQIKLKNLSQTTQKLTQQDNHIPKDVHLDHQRH